MTYRVASGATTTHVFVSIPEGALITGRVKEVQGVGTFPDEAHPGQPHEWREMLHYGKRGTGFAECRCGAIGVPFKR